MVQLFWKIALTCAYRLALAHWYIFRPETHGVYVVIWFGDEVLTIRNSYKPTSSFPAGGIKSGESATQAAIRETREEVGIELTPEQLHEFGDLVSHTEYKVDRCTVFEVVVDKEPAVRIDHREVQEAKFVAFNRLETDKLATIAAMYVERIREQGDATPKCLSRQSAIGCSGT